MVRMDAPARVTEDPLKAQNIEEEDDGHDEDDMSEDLSAAEERVSTGEM